MDSASVCGDSAHQPFRAGHQPPLQGPRALVEDVNFDVLDAVVRINAPVHRDHRIVRLRIGLIAWATLGVPVLDLRVALAVCDLVDRTRTRTRVCSRMHARRRAPHGTGAPILQQQPL